MAINVVKLREQWVMREPAQKLSVYPGSRVQVEDKCSDNRYEAVVTRVTLNTGNPQFYPGWEITTEDGTVFSQNDTTITSGNPDAKKSKKLTVIQAEARFRFKPGEGVYVIEAKKPWLLERVLAAVSFMSDTQDKAISAGLIFTIIDSLKRIQLKFLEVVSPASTDYNSAVYVRDPKTQYIYLVGADQIAFTRDTVINALPGARWKEFDSGYVTLHELQTAQLPLALPPAPGDYGREIDTIPRSAERPSLDERGTRILPPGIAD